VIDCDLIHAAARVDGEAAGDDEGAMTEMDLIGMILRKGS